MTARMSPKRLNNPFLGRWRIERMELWDRRALDLVVPAFLQFDAEGQGECRLIAVHAWLDCRFVRRDGEPAVEFSWEGDDAGDLRCGRGWAVLRDGRLEGRWFFHNGDDSSFVATKSPPRAVR